MKNLSIIHSSNFVVEWCELHPKAIATLGKDENCQRSMMGKEIEDIVTPQSSWLRATHMYKGMRPDFILLDPTEGNSRCCHLMMLKENKNNDHAREIVMLATLLLLSQGIIPYTTVSIKPEYEYMNMFLLSCGMYMVPEHHLPEVNMFTPPYPYNPDVS